MRQAIEARRAKTRSGFVLAREPGPEGETPPLSQRSEEGGEGLREAIT